MTLGSTRPGKLALAEQFAATVREGLSVAATAAEAHQAAYQAAYQETYQAQKEAHQAQQLLQKAAEDAQRVAWAAAQQVVISGATGPSTDDVNGRYDRVDPANRTANRVDRVYRKVYRKVGERDRWLFVNSNGKWMVGTTENKKTRKTESTGYAEPVALADGLPPAAGDVWWSVWDGIGKSWVEQMVQVETLDASQVATVEAARSAAEQEAAAITAAAAAHPVVVCGGEELKPRYREVVLMPTGKEANGQPVWSTQSGGGLHLYVMWNGQVTKTPSWPKRWANYSIL